MVKFSILVMSVPSRIRSFTPCLLEELERQVNSYSNPEEVEILCLYDNKRRSVGEKRNSMLGIANGGYLAFVDDDDRVSPSYVSSIMEKINEGRSPDCIVFDCICTIDNGPERYCKYGIEFQPNNLITDTEWEGKPAHTMVWSTRLATKHSFPDLKAGEDFGWVNEAWPDIKSQSRIEEVLYYYDFNHSTTETRN